MDFDTKGHTFCICQILDTKWEYNEAVHRLFIDFKKAYDSLRREVLYNILIELGIPMKLVRLIKMCLTTMYSRDWVGKKLSHMFPIRKGLKHGAIRRVQVHQDGLKLNGTHQQLVNADDVKILGGSIHTIKENAEAVVVTCKEIGLEVNADKTKYMVMSRYQNAARSHSIKIENSSFERVGKFRYLGTTLKNQNSIQEEIKSRWRS